VKDLELYTTLAKSALLIVDFLELYRGMLYMGIVSITGGEIDVKALKEHSRELSELLISMVPFLSNAIATYQLVNKLIDITQGIQGISLPDEIKDAQFVEQTLQKYTDLLLEWREVTKVQISQLKDLTRLAQQYTD
jgi:hypothetical protein